MVNLSHVRFKKLGVYASLAIAPILLIGAATLERPEDLMAQQVIAQSNTSGKAPFTLPTRVAEGTTVRIDGSSSLKTINDALKQQFERKFKGTDVEIKEAGSEAALAALLKDQVDLVAMGRPLTADEKAQGLVEVPLSRHKIAIVVGSDNPYSQDLKIEQFAKIFRGEIKDWSELDGEAGAIRLVDRPEISDTRQAFQNYPAFKSAPFQTGATADAVNEDQTDEMVKSLGKDGIGYAIVDQVADRSDVRILSMHKVLPTDARYPFSQPLNYVYKGPEANPAVQAFLGYAMAPENQALIESARVAGVSPDGTATDRAETPAVPGDAEGGLEPDNEPYSTADGEAGFRWWPWLLLPLLAAGALWWLLGRGAGPAAVPVAAGSDKSRLILTPRNCKSAYAYWELCDRDQQRLRETQGRALSLRLYEDLSGRNVSGSSPSLIQQVICAANAQDHHFNIPVDDRDYYTELGYESEGRWTVLERSESIRVPACSPSGGSGGSERAGSERVGSESAGSSSANSWAKAGAAAGGATALGAVAAGAAGAAGLGDRGQALAPDQIILVPRTNQEAYAYWEVTPASKQALRDSGGQSLKLRIHDVTNLDMDTQPPLSTQEYDCDDYSQDKHVAIPIRDHDYIADLGYTTLDGRWLRLVRSLSVRA
jgi:phosphate transport system substrate-binding protein